MTLTARAFVLNARAKFNVRLEIGGLTPSGLHEVRSVVSDLWVCDEVAFLPSEAGFSVSCDEASLDGRSNLVWKAAEALGIELPRVRIHVKKRLPVQSGLGGGSADGAAALRGLATLLDGLDVFVSRDRLFEAAARTGSDVPACLVPGIKVVGGTGEIVHSLPSKAPHWGVLLLKPNVGVPTARAYELLDRFRQAVPGTANQRPGTIDELRDALASGDFGRTCALVHNDFQAPVEAAYPQIAEARRRIVSAGAATTLLCGSGSCVAGIFENIAEARGALALVRPAADEWAAATGFADGQ